MADCVASKQKIMYKYIGYLIELKNLLQSDKPVNVHDHLEIGGIIEYVIETLYFDQNYINNCSTLTFLRFISSSRAIIYWLCYHREHGKIYQTKHKLGDILKNIKRTITNKLTDQMQVINNLYKEGKPLEKDRRVDFISEYMGMGLDYIYGGEYNCEFDMKGEFEAELLDFIINYDNEEKLRKVFASINKFFSQVEQDFINNHEQLSYIQNIIKLSS